MCLQQRLLDIYQQKIEYDRHPISVEDDLELNNPIRYGDWGCRNGRCSDF